MPSRRSKSADAIPPADMKLRQWAIEQALYISRFNDVPYVASVASTNKGAKAAGGRHRSPSDDVIKEAEKILAFVLA